MSVNVAVVLGAGGPTGLECVKRLLSATNAPVRAVVRDPAKYDATFKAAAAAAGEWTWSHAGGLHVHSKLFLRPSHVFCV